jgi:CDP-glycerol glycerophosphotransferase
MRRRLELVVRRLYRLLPGFVRPAARRAWPILITCLERWRVQRTRRFRVSPADAQALSRPLISVVMPVYNVAEYLPAAAGSVLSQRHVNLELILVDDGATDGSADLCDRIARKDPRVRVIHQPNAGLGAARNTGVAASRGSYLVFADSDDWVLPNAYAAMLNALLRSGSDFVTGNVVRRYGWKLRPAWNQQRSHRTDRFGTTLMSHPDLLYDSVAWNKLFRTDFWRERVGDFPVGKLYEDMLPITRAFLAAHSVDVLARPVYVWRMREDGTSITQRLLEPQNIADRMEMADAIAALLRDHQGAETLSPRLVHKILETDLWIHVRELTAGSDPAALDQLTQMVRRHWSTASPENVAAIPVDRRICYWLIENERGQDVAPFRAWWQTVHAAPSTRRVEGQVLLDLRDCPVPLGGIPDRYLVVP